ncbi:DUF1131 family protein [Roseibium sp.]|uniref:DUF1131 family protein n=1 Tax=Roseibium sp. TaxID=1936156 RepID=UPI003D11BDA8
MRLSAFGFACLLALGAAACSPTADLDGTSARMSLAAEPTFLQITEDSIGGINSSTPYSEKAIEAALPDFTTEGIQSAGENSTEWALAVFDSSGFQVLQVFKGGKGKIRTVHGVTYHVQGPNGERVGMSLSDIGTSRADCRVGKNLWRGMAICKSDGHPNVQLVYSIPGYQGPFDRLPAENDLFDAQLQRILWTPKG